MIVYGGNFRYLERSEQPLPAPKTAGSDDPPDVCAYCGSPYVKDRSNMRYCSHRCRDLATADRDRIRKAKGRSHAAAAKPPRRCLFCGADIGPERGRSRYCSAGCRAANDKLRRMRKENTA